MQGIATADRNITGPVSPIAGALVVCPAALVGQMPASAPNMYRLAHELAVQSVSRRFWARVFQPSSN